MKKKIFGFLVGLLFLLSSVMVMAADTINVSIDKSYQTKAGWVHVIKVELVSGAGADPDEFELDTSGNTTELGLREMEQIRGGILWQVVTDPGTAPDAVWAVSFDNGAGASILDLSGLSVTATEIWDGSRDLGFYPVIFDNIGIDFGDLGSTADSAILYLVILK